jgi:hypothetical protein
MVDHYRRSTHRAQDASDTTPLLDHRPRKSKAAKNQVQPPLQRAHAMFRLQLPQTCLKSAVWWKPAAVFNPRSEDMEQKLQNEKAIVQEEVRQEWMRRLRPRPHRKCSPAA